MKTTIYDSKNIPLQTGEGRSCSRGTRRTNSGEGAKRNAFTLAEVLITLGVIGVVAALTMPTLMTNMDGEVSGSSEYPQTSAPRIVSQILNQLPLKPVCPVTKTLLFL